MKIYVTKTVGSSGISINASEEKLDEVAAKAEHLFGLLPEPSLTSGENGVSVFAGLPLPVYRPGEEGSSSL